MTDLTTLQALLYTLRMRVNQEFELVYKGGVNDGNPLAGNPYKFTATELLDKDGIATTDDIISELIFGKVVIKNAQYFPKKGDKYFTVAFNNISDFRVQAFTFQSSQTDVLRSSKGMCFVTSAEAEEKLPIIQEELSAYF